MIKVSVIAIGTTESHMIDEEKIIFYTEDKRDIIKDKYEAILLEP